MRATVEAWNDQRFTDDEETAADAAAWADRVDQRLNPLKHPAVRPARVLQRALASVARQLTWPRHWTGRRMLDGTRESRAPLQETVGAIADWCGRFAKDPAAGRRFREVGWMAGDWRKSLWPYPFCEQRIGLVIRQWVQEDPNPTWAKMLASQPTWQELVDLCRQRHEDWEYYRAKAERSLAAYGHDPLNPSRSAWPGDTWIDTAYVYADNDALARLLQHCGFPATPATARHLRACAVGQSEPYPARGLVVTTLVPVRFDGAGFAPDTSNPRSSIEGPADLMTRTLLARAADTQATHREWLARYRPSPLTDRRERAKVVFPRRAKSGGSLDYLEVAKALWLDSEHSRRGTESQIDIGEHLNHVDSFVRKRRERADQDATPPSSWRDEFRRWVGRAKETKSSRGF